MTNEQRTQKIETIIGTIGFANEDELSLPYAPESFKRYEFDQEFKGKFLYIPTSEREIFIALDGRIQGESGYEISLEARKIQHEKIKEFLTHLHSETEQLMPSAGGYCTIIPEKNFLAFFGTTIRYQKGIDEMKDGLVAREINQESGGLIHRVLPLKGQMELAKEIQEISLDENGEPYVKLDFSGSVRRLKC